MSAEPIMHECIKRLLSQRDEESLECLCKLLKTLDEELDDEKVKISKENMKSYLIQMQEIVDKRLTSSRIRFMLKDVIDLKRRFLHELRSCSDNAWKPLYKHDAEADQVDLDKLKRSVQGILNKLTPQKFETLLTQAKNLNIDTEEKLCTVADLIFKNVVKGSKFSIPYANFCKHLALIKVFTKNMAFVNFRKVLLTKCQEEFEQRGSDELEEEKRLKALEEASSEEKKELEQKMYDDKNKISSRKLSNIRFIGELFKLGILTEPIMHICIKMLLSQGDEESLECLCKLLKTIGKELDDRKVIFSKEIMEGYMTQIQNIVDKRLTSSRVRFLLQDVLDLKRNDWVPRWDENIPKTIDQTRREAKRKTRQLCQYNLQNMSFHKRVPEDRD